MARPSASEIADHGDGDGQREARAPEQARERVAAQLVGSGPVGGGGAFEAMEQVDGGGIGGREPGRGQPADNKDGEQHTPTTASGWRRMRMAAGEKREAGKSHGQ